MAWNEVKVRVGIVLGWIQLLCILAGFGFAAFVLGRVLSPPELSSSDLLEVLALLAGSAALGLAAAVCLAALSFIMSGTFRMLPASKRRLQWTAILCVPLLTVFGARTFFLFSLSDTGQLMRDRQVTGAIHSKEMPTAPKTGSETESDPETPPFTKKHTTSDDYTLFTHKTTGAAITCGHVEGVDMLCVTVLKGWFLASARWDTNCKPNTEVAPEVFCVGSGDAAHTTLRVENPDWDGSLTNLNWEFDSSGFAVDIQFGLWHKRWALDTLRRVDAGLASKGVERPDPALVPDVLNVFVYEY